MLKMLKLARNLPWPIHVFLSWMTNGGTTAVDTKPKTKSKTNGRP